MKQFLFSCIFLGGILLLMTSCNDDDDDGNDGPPPVTYTFSGDIDYPFENDTPIEEWSSANVVATLYLDGTFSIIAT